MREKDREPMKGLVVLLLLLVLNGSVEHTEAQIEGECTLSKPVKPRPHRASVLDFGAVGDGKTSNTVAFQNAIFYLKSFADKGGAQLYVPAGRWLTGSINLTSHLTLFLEKDAIILGSEDYTHWDVVDPLPSYGRGIDVPGQRYRSLITGNNLVDVAITGNNGTIDGQGSVWWEQFDAHALNYSRPHLIEFVSSSDVVISNLTILNAPAWSIHPAYCSNVVVQNITVHSPSTSPYTSGIVPDSSEHVCIENSNISMGHDAIALKSGWDEYGIAYGRPNTNVHVRGMHLRSTNGAGIAFGSEMSGGLSNVLVENLYLHDSPVGIELKTARGRGGYIEDIIVSGVVMENVQVGINATSYCDTHPDDEFDPNALPVVGNITFKDIIGTNISIAGNFKGLPESPFTSICLSDISFSISPDQSTPWICSDVSGISSNVSPEPCPELQNQVSSISSVCFSLLQSYNQVAIL
nr:probable polygalacturonase isoform X1 [Ipomoea batatas]